MRSVMVAALTLFSTGLFAADILTADQQEEFLRTAKIMGARPSKKGVTETDRVTLSDGKITHDASVQTINQSLSVFQPKNGPAEFDFKDSYLFNIAGWKLAKLLGIGDMVPVSVGRKHQGQNASFTWWIDDVAMDEGERLSKKIQPPDPASWEREIHVMHVFDELIYNTDSNATNLLIDNKWHIWMIDHSRAFRKPKTLRNPRTLIGCDRDLLAKMKTLDEAMLQKEMNGYLDKKEIQGLLARRDLIVKFFDDKGEAALFDRPARQ
jgi:hypothetical protein